MEMEFLDFPGGYLSDPSHDFLEWGVVREFLESATAMIVPIDATVLMEATLPDHRRQIPRLLALEEVAGVAREWAKCRQERAGEEPALLVLAPVKCESYFADNGGLHDRSALLFETVSRAYEPIISAVRDEVHDVLVVYAPVDSVGCVEVESARWETDAQSGRVEVHVTYLVRRPPTRRVVGAEPILTNLVKQVLDARQRVAEDERRIADEKLRAPRGFLRRVWDQVSREQARKKRALREAGEASARVRARIDEFEKALERLAERSQGRRQRVL